MIKKSHQQEIETRENMRGGLGKVKIRHYLRREDLNIPCRLCAELLLPPGSGIGLHEHADEDEIYLIQKGKGLLVDNGNEVEIETGDAVATGKGASHVIKNIGQEDLIIITIVVKYYPR